VDPRTLVQAMPTVLGCLHSGACFGTARFCRTLFDSLSQELLFETMSAPRSALAFEEPVAKAHPAPRISW